MSEDDFLKPANRLVNRNAVGSGGGVTRPPKSAAVTHCLCVFIINGGRFVNGGDGATLLPSDGLSDRAHVWPRLLGPTVMDEWWGLGSQGDVVRALKA